jgi:hypothetical protein
VLQAAQVTWCPGPESNRYGPFGPRDFKSSAPPPLRDAPQAFTATCQSFTRQSTPFDARPCPCVGHDLGMMLGRTVVTLPRKLCALQVPDDERSAIRVPRVLEELEQMVEIEEAGYSLVMTTHRQTYMSGIPSEPWQSRWHIRHAGIHERRASRHEKNIRESNWRSAELLRGRIAERQLGEQTVNQAPSRY